MKSEMTLEQVRDEMHLRLLDGDKPSLGTVRSWHNALADAIDAHITQSAEASETCKLCFGRGERTADGSNGRRVYCKECNGTGCTPYRDANVNSTRPCTVCMGYGSLNDSNRKIIECLSCMGTGLVQDGDPANGEAVAALAHPRPTGDTNEVPNDTRKHRMDSTYYYGDEPHHLGMDAVHDQPADNSNEDLIAFLDDLRGRYAAGEDECACDYLDRTMRILSAITGEQAGEVVAWQYRNVFRGEKSHKWHFIDEQQFDKWSSWNDPSIELRKLIVQSRAVGVPEELLSEQVGGEFAEMSGGQGYRRGWNDCRKAMLSAAPKSGGG